MLLLLPILLHYLYPVMGVISRPYTYLGIVLMVAGLALAIWASMLFREAKTSFQLQGESTELITAGPFGFSRNPIYLGMLTWLIGLAVLLGSLTAFLFPLLFFLMANFYMIPLEEKQLTRLYRDQYTDYKQRVRRWV